MCEFLTCFTNVLRKWLCGIKVSLEVYTRWTQSSFTEFKARTHLTPLHNEFFCESVRSGGWVRSYSSQHGPTHAWRRCTSTLFRELTVFAPNVMFFHSNTSQRNRLHNVITDTTGLSSSSLLMHCRSTQTFPNTFTSIWNSVLYSHTVHCISSNWCSHFIFNLTHQNWGEHLSYNFHVIKH
jgi:hypothetical protein